MGNGCACINQDMLVERIKIKRSNIPINKTFLDIDIKFCKEGSIGPFFLQDSDNNFKNTLKILTKINYENVKHINKNNYLELNYSNIYTINTLAKIKEKIIDKISGFKNTTVINSSIFRPCCYYILLQGLNENNIHNSERQIILKENETMDDKVLNQIKCDIPRTFPKLKVLKEDSFMNNLCDLLATVSMLDKELSYVQGINFIAAFVLLITGNEKNKSLEIFMSLMNLQSKIFAVKFRGNFYLIKRF
jgi:hypothetical protein